MPGIAETIYNSFKKRFHNEPILVQSPGRINLIGEHTDYNDGFVLPAAIDKRMVLAMTPNNLGRIRLYAADMEQKEFETGLSDPLKKASEQWPNYILGVVDQLQKRGDSISGFDCLFGGNIPIGAGLSSSAALEGGVVVGLSELFGLNLTRREMAQIGQKAENNFVGMQCGIMDQFANLHGKKNHVMRLDCRTLEFSYHPFEFEDVSVLLCNSGVHHELVDSEYNVRRRQCEEGARILREFDLSVKNLRDVSDDLLEAHKTDLPEVIYNRCRFVLDENRRVLDACADLGRGDLQSFGQRMYRSHYGLRDLYEVSCKEIDVLVEATEPLEGVLGSRIMGGGFGGCTINLVEKARLEQAEQQIRELYKAKTGREMEVYVTHIGEGTGRSTWST